MPVIPYHGCAVFSKRNKTSFYESAFPPLLRWNIKNTRITFAWEAALSLGALEYSLKLEHADHFLLRPEQQGTKRPTSSNTCVRGPARTSKYQKGAAMLTCPIPKRNTNVFMSLPAAVSVSWFPKYITLQPHGPRSSSDTESIKLSFKPSATMYLFKPLGSPSSWSKPFEFVAMTLLVVSKTSYK